MTLAGAIPSGAPAHRSLPPYGRRQRPGVDLTTTAPRAPAQPARWTPLAQTTALASFVSKVMVAAKAMMAEAMSKTERTFVLPDLSLLNSQGTVSTDAFRFPHAPN